MAQWLCSEVEGSRERQRKWRRTLKSAAAAAVVAAAARPDLIFKSSYNTFGTHEEGSIQICNPREKQKQKKKKRQTKELCKIYDCNVNCYRDKGNFNIVSTSNSTHAHILSHNHHHVQTGK